ncbi:pentapeptide repeat-containing protein [Streptomyces anulatus]|uniref:pentapeptide repeat-containing protein n=1 Tax=Streptomyces anulatus TaxID=1892 RepID=UPI0036442D9A
MLNAKEIAETHDWGIMSSGIHKKWKPITFPNDPEATHQIQEWMAEESYSLFGIEHDFRGAYLSVGDFTKAWFTQAVLVNVRLTGATFYRADLQSADLTGADLTNAILFQNTFKITVVDAPHKFRSGEFKEFTDHADARPQREWLVVLEPGGRHEARSGVRVHDCGTHVRGAGEARTAGAVLA